LVAFRIPEGPDSLFKTDYDVYDVNIIEKCGLTGGAPTIMEKSYQRSENTGVIMDQNWQTIKLGIEKGRRSFIVFVAMICFVAFAKPGACGGKSGSEPAQKTGRFSQHTAVDRIIPSRSNDLFVVLKNGLTILIRESYRSKAVSSQVLVKTGSIYEGTRMGGGLSHYLEHVVSGGTTSTYTEEEIKKKIRTIGGATNAYTTYDHTVYFINTIHENYRTALDLLLDYVKDCQFNETEYQREKPVILQEFQMGANDPSRQLWQSFVQAAYRIHPLRHPVIGEKDIFLKMDKEDLIAHYKRWYTPENMVITVVGHVDKEETLGIVLKSMGGIKRTENPPYVLPMEPRQLALRRVEKAMETARLMRAMFGFRTVPLTHPDLYALDVLAVVMGDGRTSSLYRRLRDEKRLVLGISAGSWTPYFADGQLTVSMSLSPENLSGAEEALWDVIEDIKRNSVDEESLSRAKNKVLADHIFGSESAEDQASQMASDWIATGDPYFSDSYVKSIRQVAGDDIQRVAEKYFKKENLTIAVVSPPSESGKIAPGKIEKPADSGIEKRILKNGMSLLLKETGSTPIVSFQFVAKGGLRFEPPDQSGISRFMAGLLTKGTKNRSKLDIAKALEDVGGSIGASSGNNTVGVSVTVLKEHFDTALEVLADVVLNPAFLESEIEKQREDTMLAIKRLDERWTTEISRLFKRHYYRKHPYGNDVLGKPETVARFTKKDIQEFYHSIMMANNAVLAVFGDIDPEKVTAKIQEAFNDFRPGVLEQPDIAAETTNIVEAKSFVTFNEKTSAAILVGYNGLQLNDPDIPAVHVLDATVSGIGYPSGWLHEALRGGEKSLVYFIHAYPAFGIDGGYFGVMTQTTPNNYDEVVEIILDRMALIQRKEMDAENLEEAKNICITMHELGLETIAGQASSAALNEAIGLGYDYDITYPKRIRQVTAADVLQVAKRLLSHHMIVATKPETVSEVQ
jgi:zinc protease